MPQETAERDSAPSCDGEDDFLQCRICNLDFATETDKNVHVLTHSQDCLSEDEILRRRQLFYREVKKQREKGIIKAEPENVKYSPPKPSSKPRRIYRPQSKRVGLTKIRMEDCLRCDACSCMYIDHQDYYKHMRNFHQKYNTVIPRLRGQSPVNQRKTIAQDSRLSGQEEEVRLPRERKPDKPLDISFVEESIIRHKIKSRWSKVLSDRLLAAQRPRVSTSSDWPGPGPLQTPPQYDPNLVVKEEPTDDDIPFLLSQVEVKIKTEPPDDYGTYS